jgi:chromosome segregation ATPase
MATKKKNTGEDPLVLGLLRQVVDRLDKIDGRLDDTNARMDAGFKEVNARIDGVAEHVKAVDVSLGTLRQDMEHVPAELTSIKADLGSLRGERHQELEDHRQRIERLEKPLSRKTGS